MNQEQAQNVIGVKSTNPKDLQGLKKIPYHLFPMTAIAVGALQMLDGAGKYGRENYRNEAVKASIYYDAIIRHANDWFSGEDRQTDNGLRHLGGVLASAAILVDAVANGKLIDDRNYVNGYGTLALELNTETIRLTEKHKDKNPRHFSKLDTMTLQDFFKEFEEDGEIYMEFCEMFNLVMDAELRQRAHK